MSIQDIKKVIFHVGLHKTGSSSIQNTLFHRGNNKLLRQEGFLYPRCWGKYQTDAISSAFLPNPSRFPKNVFPKTLSTEEIKEKNKSNLEIFEKELSQNTAQTLILSAEDLSSHPQEATENLRNYLYDIGIQCAEFKVIIYTREPISWSTSWMQQLMKGSGGQPYYKRMKQLKNNVLPALFETRISKFINIFGEKSVFVYSFEDAKSHELGVVGHFLDKVSLDYNVNKQIKPTRTNESTSRFTTELLDYINGKIPLKIDGHHNKIRSRYDHNPLLSIRGDKYELPLEDKRKIAALTKHDRWWLKQNYNIDYH